MTNKIDKIQMPDGQVLKLNGGGSGLEVCDIGMALYVDETKGLRRYLNGQIVDINTNTQAFLNRLLEIKNTNPDYFTTEDNWQSEALLNIDGCVYKFVLNYADDGETVISVRLPKYPDYVENTRYGTPVGGSVSNDGGSLYGGLGVTTDPTKSGIQTTLKQTKLKMHYFIQIATGSETEANIVNTLENVNGFTLLESKYSDKPLYNECWLLSNNQWNPGGVYITAYEGLQVEHNTEIEAGTTVTLPSGVSYTKRGLSVKLSTETYTDYDFVLNTADETFRLPLLDGSEDLVGSTELRFDSADTGSPFSWIAGQNGHIIITFSGNEVGDWVGIHNATQGSAHVTRASFVNAWEMVSMDVKRGDNVIVSYDDTSKDRGYFFYPYKGNGSLYYYVGETVQNANLIDAGRIGEQLATKTDMLQASSASMPSSRYIDLTLGASGSDYTAPANGWFSIVWVTSSTSNYGNLVNTVASLGDYKNSTNNGAYMRAFIPARKNDKVLVEYLNMNTASMSFRFIYAEGEV